MDTAVDGAAIHGNAGDIAISVEHDHAAAAFGVDAPAQAAGHIATPNSRPANVSAPRPHEGNQAKRRRTRPTGIITWTQEDETEAARLEASLPSGQIEIAVATLLAAGKQPLPGLVAQEIERQIARRQAEERHARGLTQSAMQAQALCSATVPTAPDKQQRRASLFAALRSTPPTT
jgi:hypothetical protein